MMEAGFAQRCRIRRLHGKRITGGIAAIMATAASAQQVPGALPVTYAPLAKVKLEYERINSTGGYQKTRGQGRSCWGYN
jgi:hypothetical protein